MRDKNEVLDKITERIQKIEEELKDDLTENEINEIIFDVQDRLGMNNKEIVEMKKIDKNYESTIEKPRAFSEEFFRKL